MRWSRRHGRRSSPTCATATWRIPTIQLDSPGMRDLMLNNCRELADHGLLHWRHRWAGGEAPRGYRESGELYRLDKPALQDIWTLGANQLETTENTRKHVVGITDALDALDEKEKGAKAKRSHAAEDGASPPPKRKRGRKEQAAGVPSDAAAPGPEAEQAAEPSPAPAPAAPAPRSPPSAAPARPSSAAPAPPEPALPGVDDDGCSD